MRREGRSRDSHHGQRAGGGRSDPRKTLPAVHQLRKTKWHRFGSDHKPEDFPRSRRGGLSGENRGGEDRLQVNSAHSDFGGWSPASLKSPIKNRIPRMS